MLPNSVRDYIEGLILGGHIAPGDRIVESELAGALGISRTPIREALRELASEGLVEYLPRRGFRVRVITPKLIREIYAVRKVLEGLAVREATNNASEADIASLRHILAKMNDAARNDDLTKYFRENLAWHRFIFELAQNTVLAGIIDSLGKPTLLLRRRAFAAPGWLQRSYDYHEAIVDAMERGNGDSAGQMMEQMVERASNQLIELSKDDGNARSSGGG